MLENYHALRMHEVEVARIKTFVYRPNKRLVILEFGHKSALIDVLDDQPVTLLCQCYHIFILQKGNRSNV